MKYENLQQVFDTVARHLLEQGCRATRHDKEGSICLYRNDFGMKCAVGCLIPDELYASCLEYLGPRTLFIRGCDKNRPEYGFITGIREQFSETLLNNDLISLLSELQAIHDQAETIEWRTLLWKVAYRNELRNDVLDPNLTGREGYEA